ncbi:TetR/AcrR family transcriptional regulator [Sphingobium psychrophilum]|uniref:TetR/AcrR family transcriptional regulator n=1 Tax=Sphingobium psychrophilum TaxID=2728834 RepID=UPI001F2EF0C6|nr:TetR/AcrR family transcriptional regulator [Sphingobium psychrophilum]
MSHTASVPPAIDPRSRAAALRRELMRNRLLDTVFDLYQPGQANGHLVIDDVIQAAAVSRGSFYKYFDSLEAAVDALGERLTAGMIGDYRRLFDDGDDPLLRAVGGAAMAMLRAWHDPRWAGFTCRVDYVDYFERASTFDLMVRDALDAARSQGQMAFVLIDVAVDLIVGVTIEARRRLMRPSVAGPRAYMDEMIARTFYALDTPPLAVAAVLDRVWLRLAKDGPVLDWWSTNHGVPAS